MPRWLGLTSPAMRSTASGTTPSDRDRQIKLLYPDRPLDVVQGHVPKLNNHFSGTGKPVAWNVPLEQDLTEREAIRGPIFDQWLVPFRSSCRGSAPLRALRPFWIGAWRFFGRALPHDAYSLTGGAPPSIDQGATRTLWPIRDLAPHISRRGQWCEH